VRAAGFAHAVVHTFAHESVAAGHAWSWLSLCGALQALARFHCDLMAEWAFDDFTVFQDKVAIPSAYNIELRVDAHHAASDPVRVDGEAFCILRMRDWFTLLPRSPIRTAHASIRWPG
jgi:hypothetical protein